MLKNGSGSFRLFRVFGINVWLHWSWFLIAAYSLQTRKNSYSSPAWSVAEYLVLFFIVLLHEFGHALACKQTGGTADTIVLWPLGGIAFVRPPNRPGDQLWSLAAGPLVNVALVPAIMCAWILAWKLGFCHDIPNTIRLVLSHRTVPDLDRFFFMLAFINLLLLCFNMLPIYPLDGGQILRSLLWFVIGPVRSLYTAVVIGFIGAAAMGIYAITQQSIWFGILAFFAASRCWAGFKQAQILGKISAMPRHQEFKCPECDEAPFAGEFWRCSKCLKPFDTFATGARCPQCDQEFPTTKCPLCHRDNPIAAWRVNGPPPPR